MGSTGTDDSSEAVPKSHPLYGRVLMLTGLVLEKMNQTREALVYYRKARRQFNQCLGDDGAEADEDDEEDAGEWERERKRTGGGDGRDGDGGIAVPPTTHDQGLLDAFSVITEEEEGGAEEEEGKEVRQDGGDGEGADDDVGSVGGGGGGGEGKKNPTKKQRGNSGGGYDEDCTDSDSDDSSSLTNYSSSYCSSDKDDGDGDCDRDRAPRAPTPSSDDGWGGRRSSITERSIISVVFDGGEDGAVNVNPYLRDQAVNLIALGNLYKNISMVRERASGCW